MELPAIVLNFKAYAESLGANGARLARICDDVATQRNAAIIFAPQAVDLAAASATRRAVAFAQHCDANAQGAFTGSITPEAIKGAGAKGTFLNHSEKKLVKESIAGTIQRCASLGLETLVCAATVEEARALAALKPTAIAIEPPELIGSGVSVSKAKPEIVTGAVQAVKSVASIPVLCGAGVSNGEDAARALALGADGVLLASAFVKAKEPKALLEEIVAAVR
jgi:triosephosphate isomerase